MYICVGWECGGGGGRREVKQCHVRGGDEVGVCGLRMGEAGSEIGRGRCV